MTGYESKRAAAQDKLAQPEQEPAWFVYEAEMPQRVWLEKTRDKSASVRGWKETELYAAPPQRPWVGLTDEELKKMVDDAGFTRTDLLMIGDCVEQLADLIEATLKSKNT